MAFLLTCSLNGVKNWLIGKPGSSEVQCVRVPSEPTTRRKWKLNVNSCLTLRQLLLLHRGNESNTEHLWEVSALTTVSPFLKKGSLKL